eukprot:gene8855-7087_t
MCCVARATARASLRSTTLNRREQQLIRAQPAGEELARLVVLDATGRDVFPLSAPGEGEGSQHVHKGSLHVHGLLASGHVFRDSAELKRFVRFCFDPPDALRDALLSGVLDAYECCDFSVYSDWSLLRAMWQQKAGSDRALRPLLLADCRSEALRSVAKWEWADPPPAGEHPRWVALWEATIPVAPAPASVLFPRAGFVDIAAALAPRP